MANWVNQRLRVFGSKADLEKFYKKTSTNKSHFDLWHIHELVDGFECNSRDFERCDQIEIQDIDLKDFPKKINSKLNGKQYSQIETAWGWRPELYLKLSQLFPNLILEVYFVEECPEFVGAALYQKSQLYGESIASIELEGLIYLDEAEEEFDWDQMESMHLKNIYAGKKVDHDLRAKKINESRDNQRNQYIENQKKSLSDILNDIQKNDYSSKDAKKYEQKIIDILTYDNANLDIIPKKILTNNIIIAVLDNNNSEGSKLTEDDCSDELMMQLCQRGMARQISNLPRQIQKPQQLQTLLQNVKYDFDLKSIPENMRTNAVCWAGLEKGDVGVNFELIPSKILTFEMIKFAVQRNALIDKLDPKLITKELAELAVNTKPETFKFVPINLQSEKLVNIALASNGTYHYLKLSVDHLKNPKIRNKKILRKILLKNIGYRLDTLSEEEFMMIFGGREGSSFITKLLEQGSIEQIVKNIPEKFIQKSHRKKIKEKDPVYGYPYLSDEDKTLDLTLKYIDIPRVLHDVDIYKCIPARFRNKTTLEKLIEKSGHAHKWDNLGDLAIHFIKQDIVDKSFYKLFFPIQLFSSKLFTKEQVKFIKKNYPSNPNNMRNSYPSFIDFFLPKEFQDINIIKKELKKDFSLFLYLSPSLKKYFIDDVILIITKILIPLTDKKKLLAVNSLNKIDWADRFSTLKLILKIKYKPDSFREDAAKAFIVKKRFSKKKKPNYKIYDQALKIVQEPLSQEKYELILFKYFYIILTAKSLWVLINYPKLLGEFIYVQIHKFGLTSRLIQGSPSLISRLIDLTPEDDKRTREQKEELYKSVLIGSYLSGDTTDKIARYNIFENLSDEAKKAFYKSPLSELKTNAHYFSFLDKKTQNKHSFIIDAFKVNPNILKYVPTNYIKKKMNLMKLFEIKDLDNPSDKISTLVNVIGTKTKFFNDFDFVKSLINKNYLDLENILTNIEYFKLNKNSLLFLSNQIK